MIIARILHSALIAGCIAISSTCTAQSVLERIATSILADKFGIDIQQVLALRTQTKLPVYELAPLYEGAYYFKRDPRTIWQARQQGMGWGQIAQQVGMQPGTFNKLRVKGAFDRDQFWTSSFGDRFGVPHEQVVVLRTSAGSLEDALGAIVVGKLTKKHPREVYDQFQKQKSWETVARINNVRFEDWKRVSHPVRTKFVVPSAAAKVKSKSDSRVRNRGAGVGKGKPQVKSAKARVKAKVGQPNRVGPKGQAKGGAKDHGSGKGKGKGKGG